MGQREDDTDPLMGRTMKLVFQGYFLKSYRLSHNS